MSGFDQRMMEKMIWNALESMVDNLQDFDKMFHDTMVVGYGDQPVVVSEEVSDGWEDSIAVKTTEGQRERYGRALVAVSKKIERMGMGAFDLSDWEEYNEPRKLRFVTNTNVPITDNVYTVSSRAEAREWIDG